jgi:hypothetical protein
MPRCETCGNEYEKAFKVVMQGRSHTFDSFECAIKALAPVCPHCSCTIIGHGFVANDGQIFCCEHCARHANEPPIHQEIPVSIDRPESVAG